MFKNILDKVMPHSELHKQKFKKNLAVFLIILGLIAALFALTVVRMGPGG